MRRAILTVLVAGALASSGVSAYAQQGEAKPKPGTVLTFYGLLKLEQDPDVSDERKLQEWQAFIKRASEQTVYAKKAVDRWKNAAKVRLVEAARAADNDKNRPVPEKIERWSEVARLYPKSKEGRQAKRRAAHWRRMETKRLVEAAEGVEASRRPKVERINAWAAVSDWAPKASEARAARRRITQLQAQLFTEAQSVDRIARVDIRTKLDAWRDVLAGRPSAQQKRKAEGRVAALEAELVQQQSMRAADGPASDSN